MDSEFHEASAVPTIYAESREYYVKAAALAAFLGGELLASVSRALAGRVASLMRR